MKNILEIKDLNLSFHLDKNYAVQALYDVSFHIEQGKTLALVGESGCGKSMTAMSIMKLLPKNAFINSGEIIYNSENILNLDNSKMQKIRGDKIVLIPQDPLTSLNPLYTIGDQIIESIIYHQKLSQKEAKELAIKVMKDVNIPDAENRLNDYPHQFSGGMRQRAIIAMALSGSPELIIADEPTTALDVTIQAQILGLINDVQKKYNTSLLLITHDLGIVAEVSDFVAVMYNGKIVEYTDVKSLFKDTKHPYTKGLIDSLPNTTGEKLKPIPGQPPEIQEQIAGCAFHPRCKFCHDVCKIKVPILKEASTNHKVACHLF